MKKSSIFDPVENMSEIKNTTKKLGNALCVSLQFNFNIPNLLKRNYNFKIYHFYQTEKKTSLRLLWTS